MKKILITILYLFIISYSYAQNEIDYDRVLSNIRGSSKVLCTNFIIPNEDFSIGIFTEEWDVEDLTMEQCGDIKTDSSKNSKILEIFDSLGLLENIYIQLDKNNYSSINSDNEFEWNKMNMVIDLSSINEWDKMLYSVFIPIKEKNQALELIKLISNVFDADYCFKKFKRKL